MSALSAMCVRAQGKGGKAFGLSEYPCKACSWAKEILMSMQGLRKNIFIQISDENPDLSQPATDITIVSASASVLGIEASNASSDVR